MLDRPHLDTRLIHFQQEEAQALVGHRAGVGASDDKTVIGLMGQRGPHFLAGDQPLAAGLVKASPGLDIGQIRSGARLGIALAPELGTGDNTGQVFLFLGFTAKGENGRPGQALADMTHPTGGSGAGIFFKKDHLLFDRTAAASVALGPADTGPTPRRQGLLPCLALGGKHMLVAGATAVF